MSEQQKPFCVITNDSLASLSWMWIQCMRVCSSSGIGCQRPKLQRQQVTSTEVCHTELARRRRTPHTQLWDGNLCDTSTAALATSVCSTAAGHAHLPV